MFDGDFRSRRREVNLSGSNRRAGGKTKRDLLKNAEAQRKQRQERVRRDKAAKLIQRATRGHLSRLRTVRGCASDVLALSSSLSSSSSSSLPLSLLLPSVCPANLDGNSSNSNSNRQRPVMAALSMCLSHRSLLKQFDTTRRDLLLGFHRGGCRSNTIAGNNESNNSSNNNSSSNNNNSNSSSGGRGKTIERSFDATIVAQRIHHATAAILSDVNTTTDVGGHGHGHNACSSSTFALSTKEMNKGDDFAIALQLLQNNVVTLCIRAGVPVSRLWPAEAMLLNLHELNLFCRKQTSVQY